MGHNARAFVWSQSASANTRRSRQLALGVRTRDACDKMNGLLSWWFSYCHIRASTITCLRGGRIWFSLCLSRITPGLSYGLAFFPWCTRGRKLDQWFPNFLARDPKERLNICPGPKLVKTADLQAHNAPLRVALWACRSAIFTTSVDFSLISNGSTERNHWILLSIHENLYFF